MTAGVLLIRQHDQANAIEQALAQREQPVFRQPVIESQSLALSDEQLAQASQPYDGIVVVSPAAARFFDEQLRAADKAWPVGSYYCVGAGTAETLVPLCHQAVTYPAPQHTGEALLALPALQDVDQQRWLFVTGAEGRPLIADTLRKRGADLTQLEVYQRQPLDLDLTTDGAQWAEQVGIIVVTSQEQLKLFWQALPDNLSAWARGCQWVVSSPRLQSACEQFDIPGDRIIVAQNASTDALLRVIPRESEIPMSKPENKTASPSEPEQTAATKAGANKKITPAPKRAKGGGGRWLSGLIIFLLVISVAILAAGGYWVWQQQQVIQQQTNTQLEELSQRITESTRAYEELEQSVFADMEAQMNRRFDRLRDERTQEARQAREESRRERAAMQNDMNEYRQQLEEVRNQLDTSNLRLSQDMYVVEARDLVVAAGRRLWFDFDKASAIQLLQRAAEVLDRTQQSHLIPIRQQLANDIELLQGIDDIDVEGLALQLSALRTQVRDLPMDRQRLSADTTSEEAEGDVSSSFADWRSNLAKAWQSFTDDFVRVQRTEELPQMQLGAEQRYLLRTQIDLQLQIAQQAMLQHQQINFEQALEQAIEWIEAYYDTDTTATQQSLSQLRNLSEQTLEPDFPTRLLSEAMLNDAVDELLGEND
ncbi:uroporphyrinogen-III C-methyltransferase [Aliidiomarina sp. Khilg15.8]